LSKANRYCALLLAISQVIVAAETSAARLVPGYLLPNAVNQPGIIDEESAAEPGLHIEVLEGEDGLNIVKKKTAVKSVVVVKDKNNLPVVGATVIFTAPDSGPSMLFDNAARSITAVTDGSGKATAIGLKAAGTLGHFQLSVAASFQAETASLTIPVANVATAAAAAAAGGSAAGVAASTGAAVGTAAGVSGVTIGVIAGVAAAAAVGAAVGLSHKSSPATPASTPVSISAGGATAGPP
jgi:hypothetical protein